MKAIRKKLVATMFMLTFTSGLPGVALADSVSAEGDDCSSSRRFTDFNHRGGSESFEFECGSIDGCFKYCDPSTVIGNRVVRDARLIEQPSEAACIEAVSWGHAAGYLWVDHGCEGVFRVYTY